MVDGAACARGNRKRDAIGWLEAMLERHRQAMLDCLTSSDTVHFEMEIRSSMS